MRALVAKLCLVTVLSLVAAPVVPQTVEIIDGTAQFERYLPDIRRVRKAVEVRAKQLRLFQWEIGVKFDTLPLFAKARSHIQPRHRQALIVLDWEKQEVRETICSTIVHELFHAVLSPITRLTLLLSKYGEGALLETIKDTEEQLVIELTRLDVWECANG